MHPIVTTVTLAAASPTAIALAQTVASGASMTLNGALASGGVAKLDTPRRVLLTSAGNDSAITFTVTGTARPEQSGVVQQETIAGGNIAAVATTQDFATVTSIVANGASAGTVSAGTNATGSGPWVAWNTYAPDFQVSVNGEVLSGSPTWGVEYTYDDVFGTWPYTASFPRPVAFAALTNKTAAADGVIAQRVLASRLTLTAVGGVQLTQMQQG